jgi:hypothetical protein
VFEPLEGIDRLEECLARELRRPVVVDPAGKARVMELVRAVGPRRAARRRRIPGGARAGWASPFVGAALAAGVCGVMTMGALRPLALDQPRVAAVSAVAGVALGDTVASTLRDTARLVQSVLAAPSTSHVAWAGRAGRWDGMAAQVAVADASGVRTAAVAPTRHRAGLDAPGAAPAADPPAPRDTGAPDRSATTAADTAS